MAKVRELVKTIILCLVILYFVTPVRVTGVSMEPTFRNGDLLIIRNSKRVGHGDVVSFYKDGRAYIKRVIAVGGDKLKIEDGRVFLNGLELLEDYIIPDHFSMRDIECVVPRNKVFVLGDNRKNSIDSRNFGFVDINEIKGKAVVKLFSLKRLEQFERLLFKE